MRDSLASHLAGGHLHIVLCGIEDEISRIAGSALRNGAVETCHPVIAQRPLEVGFLQRGFACGPALVIGIASVLVDVESGGHDVGFGDGLTFKR